MNMQAEKPRGTQSEKFKIFRQKNGQDIDKQKTQHARENNDSETAKNTHEKQKTRMSALPKYTTLSHVL